VSGLPEFMPEAELQRRFGSLRSPGCEKVIARIDRRADATPLLRKQPPIERPSRRFIKRRSTPWQLGTVSTH